MKTVKKIESIREKKINRFLNKKDLRGLYQKVEEPSFKMSGCDVCCTGGNNVYECEGGYDICHECLCAYSNGFDSSVEIEIDNESFEYKK